MKNKQPMEFSKKIMIFAAIVNVSVIIFSMVMMILTMDISPLLYLIPATAAEVATGTGFYYAKAALENKIKLMKQYGVEPEGYNFENK